MRAGCRVIHKPLTADVDPGAREFYSGLHERRISP